MVYDFWIQPDTTRADSKREYVFFDIISAVLCTTSIDIRLMFDWCSIGVNKILIFVLFDCLLDWPSSLANYHLPLESSRSNVTVLSSSTTRPVSRFIWSRKVRFLERLGPGGQHSRRSDTISHLALWQCPAKASLLEEGIEEILSRPWYLDQCWVSFSI